MNIQAIYEKLRESHGSLCEPDNWWPIFYARTAPPSFERVISNILVQNSTWKAVPSAVHALARRNLLTASAIASAEAEHLAECVKPTGLQLQKAKRLKELCRVIVANFVTEKQFCEHVTRDKLLDIAGIGGETADRILLYACSRLAWPVDTYCLRVLTHYGVLAAIPTNPSERRSCRAAIKVKVEAEMPRQLEDWQRLHALMQLEGERLRRNPSLHPRGAT